MDDPLTIDTLSDLAAIRKYCLHGDSTMLGVTRLVSTEIINCNNHV